MVTCNTENLNSRTLRENNALSRVNDLDLVQVKMIEVDDINRVRFIARILVRKIDVGHVQNPSTLKRCFIPPKNFPVNKINRRFTDILRSNLNREN